MATYAINAISTYQFILKKMKRKDIPQIAQCNYITKFVRENIEYAYLDNALWDLLQEPQIQQQLRETLVTHFLTK